MESLRQLYKVGHGPSSSHTMGPEAACKFVLQKHPGVKKIKVTLFGSLALTGKGHLTDYIILKTLEGVETEIAFNIDEIKKHPNAMTFEVYNQSNEIIDTITVYSVGGGSIEIEGEPKNEANEDIYPFKNFDEIKQYCKDNNMSLPELVYKFEKPGIQEYLENIRFVMASSCLNGLSKTGELPGGLHVLRKAKQLFSSKIENELANTHELRTVASYAFAVSEENASGGLIVTAPTCGASGVLPAALAYEKFSKSLTDKDMVDALAVAGIIGNVIKTNASISGAFAGCQSEVGSACSMAAAAVAYLNGLSIDEIEYAAEIALEHHLGLTCDPINGLVQIPCIERNAVAALRAIDAARLANFLKGTRKISFDMVVKTMLETGKDLNEKYRETSTGGLATNYTKTKGC